MRSRCAPALLGALFFVAGCGSWPEYDPNASLKHARSRRGRKARSLGEVLALPEREIDLVRAVLLVAAELRAGVDLGAETARIDRLVADAARRIGSGGTAREAVEELNELLLADSAESGRRARSERDFDVTEVLAGRRGNCLNCAMLYLAVGDRLGLDLHAVVAPGHIFIRYDDGARRLNIETTQGGGQLTDRRYRLMTGVSPQAVKRGAYMRSLSRREFLAEVLAARGGLRARAGQFEKAEGDIRMALSVLPDSVSALVNLGFLQERRGRHAQALGCYRRALAVDPGNPSALNNLAGLLVANPRSSHYDPIEAEKLAAGAMRGTRRAAPQRRAAMLDTAARVAAALKKWREASQYARQASKLRPLREDYRKRAEQYSRRAEEERAARGRRARKGG